MARKILWAAGGTLLALAVPVALAALIVWTDGENLPAPDARGLVGCVTETSCQAAPPRQPRHIGQTNRLVMP